MASVNNGPSFVLAPDVIIQYIFLLFSSRGVENEIVTTKIQLFYYENGFSMFPFDFYAYKSYLNAVFNNTSRYLEW